MQRRDNLTASASDLQAKLEAARGQVGGIEELKKIELLEERDAIKLEQARAAQAELEEVGSGVHHRVAS